MSTSRPFAVFRALRLLVPGSQSIRLNRPTIRHVSTTGRVSPSQVCFRSKKHMLFSNIALQRANAYINAQEAKYLLPTLLFYIQNIWYTSRFWLSSCLWSVSSVYIDQLILPDFSALHAVVLPTRTAEGCPTLEPSISCRRVYCRRHNKYPGM